MIRVITANDYPQPHCVRQFIVNKRQQRVCCCGEESRQGVIQSDSEESIAVIRKTVSVIREMVRLGEIYCSSKKRNTISRGIEIYGRMDKSRKA